VIEHSRKLIFVHIQKTGGDAVCSALGVNPHCPEKHHFASGLREAYGHETWQSYFKFAIVRNPWDRLVSWWAMIDANREKYARGETLNNFQNFILERATTFQGFLENCDAEIVDDDGAKWIYRNQLDYLSDASGRIMVDFVGRYEALQQDFDSVMRRIGVDPPKLPVVNTTVHLHYTHYYSPALVEKVRERFARDIAAFGYEFAGAAAYTSSKPGVRGYG
jgi:chondroitin 4-sulfotransferase 11